jgi:hypothetical protein
VELFLCIYVYTRRTEKLHGQHAFSPPWLHAGFDLSGYGRSSGSGSGTPNYSTGYTLKIGTQNLPAERLDI